MNEQDDMADEISGWPIGSGYESVTIGIDEARDISAALRSAGYGLIEDKCCCGGSGCGL